MGVSKEELWSRTKCNFEVNDGSLPTVELSPLSGDEVASIYAFLRGRSRLASENSTFWDHGLNRDRPIDDVPNAALLVSNGSAAAFHFTVDGVHEADSEIPCLGVHVFMDCIAIDYQMGPEWNAQNVYAFFQLLKSIFTQARAGSLQPDKGEGPPKPELFMAAWRDVLAED